MLSTRSVFAIALLTLALSAHTSAAESGGQSPQSSYATAVENDIPDPMLDKEHGGTSDHSPDDPALVRAARWFGRGVKRIFHMGKEEKSDLDSHEIPPPPPKQFVNGGWVKMLDGAVFSEAMSEVVNDKRGVAPWQKTIKVEVSDERDGPIANATVLSGWTENGFTRMALTNARGEVEFEPAAANEPILVRKPGYHRYLVAPRADQNVRVRLDRFNVRGVYVASVKNVSVVNSVIKLYDDTQINALVIDYKADLGQELKSNTGAEFMKLRKLGFYTIARITSFKDNKAAKEHPEWALKRADGGGTWVDRGGQAFLDPRNDGARSYIIDVAERAAKAGFDEIEFDYVRFPSDGTPSGPSSRRNIENFWNTTADVRAKGVGDFLAQARQRLSKYGVFVAADIFGIAGTEPTDASHIGQKLEVVSPSLDYICPMVYPSGYASGSLGVSNPDGDPGTLVERATRKFVERSSNLTVVRPWLQYFNPYTGRPPKTYGATEIGAQVDAVNRLYQQTTDANLMNKGKVPVVDGYLMWNAASRFDRGGFAGTSTRLAGK